MTKLVADTNIILRFLLKDNLDQFNTAREILIKVKEDKLELAIPQIVMFEIIYSLDKYYGFPKEKIIDALSTIIGTKNIKIQDQSAFKRALTLFGDNNLSFVDCFLIAYSEENDAKLFTFDKDLQKKLIKN